MNVQIYDERVCKLGKGSLWHPGCNQLFWIDILNKHLLCTQEDTVSQQILRQALSSKDEWPVEDPEIFIDLRAKTLNPDGAVIDASGCLWSAQWGAVRVARHSPTGEFLQAIDFPASQISFPAFGGKNYNTLLATSAAIGKQGNHEGITFSIKDVAFGLPEYSVNL